MAAGIGRNIISSQQDQAHGREFGGALGVERDRDSHIWNAAVPGVAKSWTRLSDENSKQAWGEVS